MTKHMILKIRLQLERAGSLLISYAEETCNILFGAPIAISSPFSCNKVLEPIRTSD